ncbi:HNH endonuclease signature motif containing protein [Microbacterium sp. LMI1-1-1.1]|uniref:HNH endonuclease signature motif containing protein n=1 Tax=Microbacterium sp. LMI1-1-1.1 TaxID=3135223 RepID=UPI0034653F19
MISTPPALPGLPALDALAGVVDEVVTAEAAVAAAEARRVRALAAAGRYAQEAMAGQRSRVRASEMALREVASEIAAATALSDRSVQRQIDEAMTLSSSLPGVVAAWEAGALSRSHVRVIADVGARVPPGRKGEFDRLAVEVSPGLSPGRLRTTLAAMAERLHPTTVTQRHRAAHERRGVRLVPGTDGTSDLIATLHPVHAAAIYDRLTQQAHALIDLRSGPALDAADEATRASERPTGEAVPDGPDPADERTTDQVRADILTDMLLTAAPAADPTREGDGPGTLGAIRARVQVVVPVLTMLTPESENLAPAELVGHGPVDVATARALAEATTVPWDRVLTHPVTGEVLATDTYQRTAAIDRHLRARDRRCRWPGCTAAAVRCEVDHTRDHALGGATHVGNLAHLCQRHHSQKQFTRWTVRQHPGGVLEWTSPTGRTYLDVPEAYPAAVAFVSTELEGTAADAREEGDVRRADRPVQPPGGEDDGDTLVPPGRRRTHDR